MSTTYSTSQDYDFNFMFPVRTLENEKVKVTPFIRSNLVSNHKEMTKYLPAMGPFDSPNDFLDIFIERFQKPQDAVLFVVYDKSTKGKLTFAGVICYLNTSVVNQCTEIGFVCTIPPFQRTHVTTNSVGLLLQYALELPPSEDKSNSDPSAPINPIIDGGLGIRRVVWQAHHDNAASLRAAERLGFRREGLIRWQRTLRSDKPGLSVSEDRAKVCNLPGRHSWMLSVCWDDWELEGAREKLQALMDR